MQVNVCWVLLNKGQAIMKAGSILLEPVENGTVVEYWEEGEQKKKIFTNQKTLFKFLEEQLKK